MPARLLTACALLLALLLACADPAEEEIAPAPDAGDAAEDAPEGDAPEGDGGEEVGAEDADVAQHDPVDPDVPEVVPCPEFERALLRAAPGVYTLPGFTLLPSHLCTGYLDRTDQIIEWSFAPAEGSVHFQFNMADPDQPGWFAPRQHAGDSFYSIGVQVNEPIEVTLTLTIHPPPPDAILTPRSLAWTDPALLDDVEALGLERVVRAALGEGAAPGVLLDRWFRRFSTTAHSERLGPLLMLEEFAAQQGDDPAAWDIDALPFKATAVHNRLDLYGDDHCGELRVSFASTHPLYQPLHLIFLFRQPRTPADASPDGATTHCVATATRWARLSTLEPEAFRQEARALLDAGLRAESFLLAESVEFTVSPWEWRQWTPNPDAEGALPFVFDNPPLFQTLDAERLNRPGAERDDLLAWVAQNADALNERTVIYPERFRPRSARVNAGVPWMPLSLSGLDPAITTRLPDLRRNLEITGCPACHSADAEFVQTLPDRTFSPFYTKELEARRAFLRETLTGPRRRAPFGPLQAEPVLTP